MAGGGRRTKNPEDLDPVRRQVFDRIKKSGINTNNLSNQMGHSKSYVSQYLWWKRKDGFYGSPRYLPERERKILAEALRLDERILMPPSTLALEAPELNRVTLSSIGTKAPNWREVPAFADTETIEPRRATRFLPCPPEPLGKEIAFALWITRNRGRTRIGDAAYVQADQGAVTIADTAVVILDNEIKHMGEVTAMNENVVQIDEGSDGRHQPVKCDRNRIRVLKILWILAGAK